MKPNNQEEHSVELNPKVGWTIIYEDKIGELLFCFEIGKDPKTLYLNKTPIKNGSFLHQPTQIIDKQNWISLAITRVSSHFELSGMKVVVE